MGLLLAILLLMPFYAVLHGWYVATLWAWFVVPLFGAPALSIPAAIGVSLAIGAIKPTPMKSDDKRPTAEKLIEAMIEPVVRVGFGVVIALCVRGFL